jgi:hypothetical protein
MAWRSVMGVLLAMPERKGNSHEWQMNGSVSLN